jgi:hypothetical protein
MSHDSPSRKAITMTVTPGDDNWIEVEGGYARSVIDLANPEPEIRLDQVAPGLSRITGRPLPVRIGHTLGNVRDADRICTDGIVYPAGGGFIDCECADCDSALAVLPNQEPGRLWLVIEHSPTCPVMTAWIAGQAGDLRPLRGRTETRPRHTRKVIQCQQSLATILVRAVRRSRAGRRSRPPRCRVTRRAWAAATTG